jgi:hypothetical protein
MWTKKTGAAHTCVEAIREAVAADSEFNRSWGLDSDTPNQSTRKALKDADDRYKPISTFLDLEKAIRLEFLDFKRKWDSETA